VPRYNIYPAAELDGAAAPGYSQGQAIDIMEKLAREVLPDGFAFEWTTLAFQQIRAGNTAAFAFVLGVVFVFLVLAAQFESLTLPLAIIMIVPMCLVSAITGVLIRGQDNNILTQVGFIVLIALAAKNAVLIVEFAKQVEDRGVDRFQAAVEAARLRFRPILMTSLAFIFGVAPLVWAVGAGAELRQTLGTTVFSGMIGVTVFGLIFTPVFYVIGRWVALRSQRRAAQQTQPAE
jgi:multidrug efflux pump subunit AcrB